MTTNHTKCNQKHSEVSTFCNLTEQWKKGELEQGYYYTRYTPSVGKPFVEIELKNYLIDLAKVRDAETVEVLAPVPSYEEWQQLHKFLEEFNALDVAKENQQLKDIISKMCMELVDPDDDMSNGLAEYFNQDLLLEINEVLK